MRVLAIDTSNLVLSVAVVDQTRVLGEVTTNLQKNHSIRMMDTISELLDTLQLVPEDLTGIAVAKGPGSYTGVRIGVSTAKSMAWALGIPVVGVSSLLAVAANAWGFAGGIIPMFDARRGQVYTGYYQSANTGVSEAQSQAGIPLASEARMPLLIGQERIILLTDWLGIIKEQAQGAPLLFLGDDTAIHRETIITALGAQALFAPSSFNHPRAAHIGIAACGQLEQAGSAHDLVPEYLQVSEAEAKWLANQNR